MRSRRSTIRKNTTSSYWVLLFSGIILISVILGTILFGTIRTEAASSEETYKYYTSISIQTGDTLWSIAEQYGTAECGDITDYIEEICSLNHITDDDIHAGQYLTIPYYSTEYK